MNESMKIIKRILKNLFPLRFKILLIFGFMLVSAVINFILPITNKMMIDMGLLKGNLNVVINFSLVSFFLVILDQIIRLLQVINTAYINNIFNYRWTSRSIRKLLRMDTEYLNSKNFTEVVNNIRMDISNISRVTEQYFAYRILNILSIIGGVIGLFTINPTLITLILLVIPIKCILTIYFTRKIKEMQKTYMEQAREYSSWYGDKLAGIKEIKLGGIRNLVMGQFKKLQKNIIKSSIRMQITDNLNMMFDNILERIAIMIIYISGAIMINRGIFTIGGLFAFSSYSISVIHPISSLVSLNYDFAKIRLSAKRLFEFMDMKCEKSRRDSIRINTQDIRGNIEFLNISYKYKNGSNALNNISFRVRQGEKVAIVGSNGSGKTTLFNILNRLYEPDEGEVLIDGMSISDIHLGDYRE